MLGYRARISKYQPTLGIANTVPNSIVTVGRDVKMGTSCVSVSVRNRSGVPTTSIRNGLSPATQPGARVLLRTNRLLGQSTLHVRYGDLRRARLPEQVSFVVSKQGTCHSMDLPPCTDVYIETLVDSDCPSSHVCLSTSDDDSRTTLLAERRLWRLLLLDARAVASRRRRRRRSIVEFLSLSLTRCVAPSPSKQP